MVVVEVLMGRVGMERIRLWRMGMRGVGDV